MQPANLKYLDEIQEEDQAPRSRLGLWFVALALSGLATLVVVGQKSSKTAVNLADPLAELVKKAELTKKNNADARESSKLPAALKVAPLKVDEMLGSSPTSTQPTDSLIPKPTVERSKKVHRLAESGHEGGFQLQVASLKKRVDADVLVRKLRRRGHRAYRRAARVPKRGLWHRVRIGPFESELEAQRYQDLLAVKEGTDTLLVKPKS